MSSADRAKGLLLPSQHLGSDSNNGMATNEQSRSLLSFWGQVLLVMRRNYWVKRRRYWETAAEVLFPMIFFFLLLVLQAVLTPLQSATQLQQTIYSIDSLPSSAIVQQQLLIPFAPNDPNIQTVMNAFASGTPFTLVGFSSSAAMDAFLQTSNATSVYCAVLFAPSASSLSIQIRFRPSAVPDPSTYSALNSGVGTWQEDSTWTDYVDSGFLFVQNRISQILLSNSSSAMPTAAFNFSVSEFPVSAYNIDRFHDVQASLGSMYLVIGFMPLVSRLTQALVIEKEKKLKELMRMMGLSTAALWFGWHFTYSIVVLIPSLLLSGISIAAGFYHYTPFFSVFILLYLYLQSLILLSFTISQFFSNSRTSGSMGGLMFFLLYLPNYALTSNASKGVVYFAMLSPPIAFAQAYAAIAQGEIDGNGVVFFDNLSGGSDAIVPYSSALIFVILDIFIFGFIAFYLENVLPSAYGVKKSRTFLFDSNFWCPPPPKQAEEEESVQDDVKYADDVSWEEDDEEKGQRRKKLLKIRKLTKSFNLIEKRGDLAVTTVVRAVNDVSLDGFESEIIGLLGPNGAGKSTTFNMLCGLIPPDYGRATIAGYDLSSSLDSIHRSIGICMQENALFEDLTMREHLYFFGRLKGLPAKDINMEIYEKLREFQLEDKADSLSGHLSGGQQRRLSCMIAFMGGSRIIFLDEPSSGLDPASKRRLWNVILKYKKGRLIVLSTHAMDEADVLSDRIVMLSKGRLRCVGSALFLKNRFGSGYHLTLLPVSASSSLSSALSEITSLIPTAAVDRRVLSTGELSLLLPFSAVDKFPAVLHLLEDKQKEFGLKTFGISMTTMEEVFLKLAREAEEKDAQTNGASREEERKEIDREVEITFFRGQPRNNENERKQQQQADGNGNGQQSGSGNGANSPLLSLTEEAPAWLQLSAFLRKRFLQIKRNRRAFFFSIVYPLIFAALVHFISNSQSQISVTTHTATTIAFAGSASPLLWYGKTSLPWTVGSSSAQPELAAILAQTGFQSSAQFVNFSNGNSNDVNLRNYLLTQEQIAIQANSNAQRLGAIYATSSSALLNLQVEVLANNTALHFLPFMHNQLINSLLTISPSSYLTSLALSAVSFVSAPFSALPDISVNYAFIATNAIFLGIAFASLPVSYAINIVRERVNGSKQLTISMGGRAHLFWIGNFIFDFFGIYCVAWFLLFLLEYILGEKLLFQDNFNAAFLMYFSYGLCSVSYAYFVSLFFKTELGVQSITPMLFSFGTLILYFVMSAIKSESGGMELIRLFSILPQFSFFFSLSQLATASATRQQCDASLSYANQYTAVTDPDNKDFCPNINFSEFTDDPNSLTLGPTIFTLLFTAVMYAAIVVVVEKRLVERYRASRREAKRKELRREIISKNGDNAEAIRLTFYAAELDEKSVSAAHADDDIASEHAYVEQRVTRLKAAWSGYDSSDMDQSYSDPILVSHLTKDYPLDSAPKRGGGFLSYFTQYKRALSNVSFAVRRGEIFSILGPSGAGKTSLLKVLTKEEDPTDGEAFLANYSISNGFANIFPLLGVVSQFDGLMDLMTGRETLEYYARIKGLESKSEIAHRVETVLKWVELYKHADKLVTQYSGGMKRRLALAVALVGYRNNKLLFLDEFSTGVDPELRRQLWTVLQRVQPTHAILLTSHSMEEAEFLSSRLSILMKGKMKCIGAIQSLKEKYGKGYQLEMKFKFHSSPHDDADQSGKKAVQSYLDALFARLGIEANVLEEFCGKWKLSLNSKELPLPAASEQGVSESTIMEDKRKFPLAELFEEFEKLKNGNMNPVDVKSEEKSDESEMIELIDYSISQFSLEQIFLKMEKESEEQAVEEEQKTFDAQFQ